MKSYFYNSNVVNIISEVFTHIMLKKLHEFSYDSIVQGVKECSIPKNAKF